MNFPSFSQKRIVVTGAGPNGFLGFHVKKHFDKQVLDALSSGPVYDLESGDFLPWNHFYISYIGSEYYLLDFNQAYDAWHDHDPDVILHMAAVCGGILANKNSPADFLTKNTQMSLNLYESALKYAKRKKKHLKIYTLGSVCSYPEHCPVPFKEDDLFNGYPEPTNAPYGQAKRTLLMLGQTYQQQYPEFISGAHFLPANLFGEKDHFDLVNSHVIPALINKFVTAKEQNLPEVQVWGTGEATREFLFAGDLAKCLFKAINQDFTSYKPINVGTGQDISIKDLAYLLRKLTNYSGKIVFTKEVSDGQPQRRLNVERAKKLLGFEAETSLQQGLQQTIDWYYQNKDKYDS